jgi:nucleoside-diphosphate-sugar epimerase
MSARPPRVLITGATGFLGAGLARQEIATCADVHLLLRPRSDRWRLAGLEGCYTPHWADLLDAAKVRQAVADARPEVIYHLAAGGASGPRPPRSATLAASLLGTAHLLDALDEHDYRVLVHAGSGWEYGPRNEPIAETDPVAPHSDYGVAKAAASLLCQAESRRGKPIVIVRIFAAYGPGEDPRRLVPYVMDCCLRGQVPRVSAGWQCRDWIHSTDVHALLRAAAQEPRACGQVLHAGTGCEHSVREVVQTILGIFSREDLKPEFGAEPLRSGESPHYQASRDRTTTLTGWTPRYDLRTGLQAVRDWFLATDGARRAAA